MILGSLVPKTLFSSLSELILWLLVVGGITVLVIGADRAVAAAAKLAAELGLSKIIIGATVVSLGTTAPETVVSVKAAMQGNGGTSLGNGIGSVICDTALIFGLCCMLSPIPRDKFIMNRQGWIQLGSGVLLAGLVAGAWFVSGDVNSIWLGRPVGIILLILLAGYLYMSAVWAKSHSGCLPELDEDEEDESPEAVAKSKSLSSTMKNLFWLVFGLAMVVFGAEFLLGSVERICVIYEVPDAVIAATVVAFGTSLPELVTALTALRKGHKELLVGNVIGADILNIFFVIGASAFSVPLRVTSEVLVIQIPAMIIVLMMLKGFSFGKSANFKRWQGAPLLLTYVAFIIVLTFFSKDIVGLFGLEPTAPVK